CVGADADHHGIETVEQGFRALVALHLPRAHGRERKRVERHDDGFLAAVIREPDHLAGLIFEREIWRNTADWKHGVFWINMRRLPGLLLAVILLLFIVPST